MDKRRKEETGFTLIELLVVISVISFLVLAGFLTFNLMRMEARDTMRVANITQLAKALAVFLNDSSSGYPSSNGECIAMGSGVIGPALVSSKSMSRIPLDPLWPIAAPNPIDATNKYATGAANSFCYWYSSPAGSNTYYISYYLESNTKAGAAGLHVVSPSGNIF